MNPYTTYDDFSDDCAKSSRDFAIAQASNDNRIECNEDRVCNILIAKNIDGWLMTPYGFLTQPSMFYATYDDANNARSEIIQRSFL